MAARTLMACFILSFAPSRQAARIRFAGSAGESGGVAANSSSPSLARFKYIVTRGCVRARAEKWDDLWKNVKMAPPVYENVNHTRGELVTKIWEVLDKMAQHEQHLKGYFVGIRAWKRWRSSNRGNLTNVLDQLQRELLEQGFNYDTAAERCEDSMTDEMYECMLGVAAKDSGIELAKKVEARLAAEELIAHGSDYKYYVNPSFSSVMKELSKVRLQMRKEIKAEGFSFTTAKKACTKLFGSSTLGAEYKAHALGELSVGEAGEKGICGEKEGAMCPEGTAPDTQRRLDALKGARAGSMAFVVGKAVFALGFSIAALATGGLAAVPAGFALGFGLPFATPISAAVGFYSSIGPLECACFIRDCSYNEDAGTCILESGTSWPSRNPFGKALPYAGTKCAIVPQKKVTAPKCKLQECATEDYQHFTGADGLFGKVGRMGEGLYNCLSESNGPSGSLAIKTQLPSGVNSTPSTRNELFTSMGVTPLADDPDTVPEEDAKDGDSY